MFTPAVKGKRVKNGEVGVGWREVGYIRKQREAAKMGIERDRGQRNIVGGKWSNETGRGKGQ